MSNDKYVQVPKNNIEYPFFSYGIFKPGQLAFSEIEKYVDKISYNSIDYQMCIRDGVPVIDKKENKNFKTYGYLIEFKKGSEKKAYEVISKTEPFDLYEWDEIKCNGVNCKVLKGKYLEKGSSLSEYTFEEFYGHNDPLFNEALELIDGYLKRRMPNSKQDFSSDIKNFFILQMHYMLLWTAIDRFSSLRYNKEKISNNNYHFSQQQVFINALENMGIEERKIFTADNLRKYKLDADKSNWAINYYYKVRCNIVHRGKTFFNDYDDVHNSIKELSKIFKEVLTDTFNIVTVNDINFFIPYGLKEVFDDNDSTRIFKKDKNNLIKGIPNYSIEIMDLSIINHDNEISINSKDIYKVDSKLFYIRIEGDYVNKNKIIQHLNYKLR